ncbi:hypothetical protein ES704_02883 [subsurface metagenome]|jgi:TRAP transporter TAXI family solute receptor
MFKTKSISRIIGIIVCILLMLSMSSFAAKKTAISMVTGGTAGTYFPVGGAICEIINEALPDIEITALTGNASVANINLIWKHEIESGLTQNNLSDWAYNSTKLYAGKESVKNLRAIASLFPEHMHIVAQKSANITKIDDIRGKKVSVSSPGSGGEADIKAILGALGITFDDFKAVNLDQATSAQYMKDKLLDAFWTTIGYPGSSVIDIAYKREINLVPFSDKEIETVIEKYPYYVKATIPGGVYKGVEKDTQTLACMAIWVVDADIDEEIVYQITKALWNNVNLARIHLAHAKAKEITLETALDGISIPLHLGAEKFYKEVGLTK